MWLLDFLGPGRKWSRRRSLKLVNRAKRGKFFENMLFYKGFYWKIIWKYKILSPDCGYFISGYNVKEAVFPLGNRDQKNSQITLFFVSTHDLPQCRRAVKSWKSRCYRRSKSKKFRWKSTNSRVFRKGKWWLRWICPLNTPKAPPFDPPVRIMAGHGWSPKTRFFPTFLWSRLPQAKQVRTENPWILHFREKIFRRGRPLRGSRSHRKAPQAEIFLKTNKGEAKKQKKKAGLHYIGRPSFFAFLLHLQSRISWKPMNTTFDSASNARQTRGKRASNARQTRTKSFWNSQHLILVGI